MDLNARWYALTVKHQHEKRAATLLSVKGLETLVPLYRSRRRWSDRVQTVELPLFAGYVFCRFPHEERLEVLNTPGVGGIVSFNARPAPVDDREIADLQQAMASKLPLWPWPRFEVGDRVRIERGPLKGLEGALLRVKDGLRLVLGVELLQRAVAVEVEPDVLGLLRRPTNRAAAVSLDGGS